MSKYKSDPNAIYAEGETTVMFEKGEGVLGRGEWLPHH